tara:strand:+ start:2060 stop:2380 length:321 start_codon:yes stop_codon:yes gene_type:complete
MIKKIKDLFPEDECLRVFGKKEPTVEERSVFFGNLWDEWEDTEIKLKPMVPDTPYRYQGVPKIEPVEEIKKFLYKNGQREFWDYQVHGLTLRMKDKDLAMIVRLKT